MISTYAADERGLSHTGDDLGNMEKAVWIDLRAPTRDEEIAVERALGLDVPTREEMQEIELSSRLYNEDDATFMTANILTHTDGDDVAISPLTFILHGTRLITVRYAFPRNIDAFVARCGRGGVWTADLLAIGLLEVNIERLADLIERASSDLDALSNSIFLTRTPVAGKRKRARPRNYQEVLEAIGGKGDLVSKIRDSLVSMQRLLTHYAGQEVARNTGRDVQVRLKSLSRDVEALREHASFMTQKVNFLLDATLGMINIEQNAIIKIFSVAAVIFLPPTLIASMYGMNFTHMPELDWPLGYPFAIGLMIVSAILPYLFFKRRGWL